MGISIMVEGLRLRDLNPGYAHDIAEIIWKRAEESDSLLATAYSNTLKESNRMERNSLRQDERKSRKRMVPSKKD